MVDIIYDFAIASVFIFIGQMLRAKVKFFQKLFIPASLLAGFIALILGQQVLGLLSWSDYAGDYAWTLVVMSFVAVGLPGVQFNKAAGERIGSYFCFKLTTWALQYSFPVLLTCLVLSKINLGVHDGFGLLLATGFMGGHGTAAAVGSTLESLGFEGATDIAMTFATAGILAGIFGGLAFIKWAARKGYTQYIHDFDNISEDLRTGMIEKENREPMAKSPISSISLDPLCWHLAIMVIPTASGIKLCDMIAARTGVALPEYAIGFLLALVLAFFFKKTGVNEYIDYRITDRIAGTCTDFIVFFGVARIKISVIVQYAVPLVIMLVLGGILVFLTVYYFGPHMNKESWFERSIFVYGYSTGVFAIGMLLLRICDPESESSTLQDTGFVESIQLFADLFACAAGPYMLMGGQGLLFGGMMLLVVIVPIIFAKMFKWWYNIPLDQHGALHMARKD